MSDLSRKKAIIKRAEKAAIAAYFQLDKDTLADLKSQYEASLEEIIAVLMFYGDSMGVVRLQSLQALRRDIEQVLVSLSTLQSELLSAGLTSAANLGTQPFLSYRGTEAALDISQRTTRFVKEFTDTNDGLQLSDRLWIINDNHKTNIIRAINSAVIQGHSASEAAANLIASGEKPTKEMLRKINRAETNKMSNVLKAQYFDEDAAYWQARRLFRTELNRAHGMAYQNSLEDDDDIVGTRFKLSPNHPRVDICDMHASVNRFGLGKGVYPKGKSPWPAHPNTLSYEEAVFIDEVTDEDRAGKEDRIAWLNNQPYQQRLGVIGKFKTELLEKDMLKETMINSKVKQLRKRLKG